MLLMPLTVSGGVTGPTFVPVELYIALGCPDRMATLIVPATLPKITSVYARNRGIYLARTHALVDVLVQICTALCPPMLWS